MVASAVGDALGAPYEFAGPNPSAPCDLEGGGQFRWEPGEWTDDTQMALALLTVLADGSTDLDRIDTAMLDWIRSGPRDVGNQTRAVLSTAARSGDTVRTAAARYQERHPDAAGNGALMRTGPVALAHLGDPAAVAALAVDVAAATHPHRDSVEACALWSLAIERAITTARPSERFDFVAALLAGLDLIDGQRRDVWHQRITAAADTDPADFHSSNGWVVAALQAAVAAITTAGAGGVDSDCHHLVATLQLAARSGGDTDTVAAICGALVGARWGASAVPLGWRRVLHGRRIYGEPVLRCSDLETLARLAVNSGRPDARGWPGGAEMVRGYVERFGLSPMAREIDGVAFGNAAAVRSAVDGGATVVVSLCRMGTTDVPDSAEHLTVPLIDSTADDNPNLAFVLADTARTVLALADAGERVFVHCVASENRTPTIAAGYLMARGTARTTALARIEEVLGRRPMPFLVDGLAAAEPLLGGDATTAQ